MQIKIQDPQDPTKLVWKSIRQSDKVAPYTYDTKEEAEHMLRICYGAALTSDCMRVVKI